MAPITTLTCPECGKTFTGNSCTDGIHSNYRRHLRVHTRERPYRCTYCAATFTTNTNCKRHMRLKHPELFPTADSSSGTSAEESPAATRERPAPQAAPTTPVACPDCGLEVSSHGKLRRHRQHYCPFRDSSTDADADTVLHRAISTEASSEEPEASHLMEDNQAPLLERRKFGNHRLPRMGEVVASESLQLQIVALGSTCLHQPTCSTESLKRARDTSFPCPVDGCTALLSSRRGLKLHMSRHSQSTTTDAPLNKA